MVRGQQQGTRAREVLGADAPQPEVDEEAGEQHDPCDPVGDWVHSVCESTLAIALQVAAHMLDTHERAGRYS